MFFVFKRFADGETVVCRKDAVRFVEPWGHGVLIHIDGIGPVRTDTYDLTGFAVRVADLDEEMTELELAA